MITGISKAITKLLLSNGYLAEMDIDETIYGLFSNLSKILFAFICLSFGIVFNCIVESIFFYISFLFVKKYAGGFHASTESRCIIISTASILLSVWFISFGKTSSLRRNVIFVLAIISGAIISFLAPISTAEKPISLNEAKRFRLFSFLRVVGLLLLCGLLYYYSKLSVCIAICISIVLEGVFLIIGYIKTHLSKKV